MAEQTSTIGKNTQVRGTIRGDEDLVVEGVFDGTLVLTQQLVVEQDGSVTGEVDVAHLSVHGVVSGTVRASEGVYLANGAQLDGEVTTPRLVVESGGTLNAQVQMNVDLPPGVQA